MMNESISDLWNRFLRILKPADNKKKSYTTKRPNLISIAYIILFYLISLAFAYRSLTDGKSVLPILLFIPALIGIFFFYFFLPIRLLNFILSRTIILFYLRKIKKNVPSNIVIVTGKSEYKSPSFWFSPNYDLDIVYLVKYLKLKNEEFSIYENVDIDTLDKIMYNKNIKTIYLVGHGRRHGFAIDSNTVVDYCRYNDPKYKKDYVYQIHCNPQKGTSLVEYIVDEKNRKECLPEHGYISNFGINQMFIDKIIECNNYGKFGFIVNIWYKFLSLVVPLFAFVIWIVVFTKIIG